MRNINLGDKVYKLSSKSLSKEVKEFYEKENIKIPLKCKITIKKDLPISLEVTSLDDKNYASISIKKELDISPVDAISTPLTEERIISQLTKTTDTEFEFNFQEQVIVEKNSIYFFEQLKPMLNIYRKVRGFC